MREQRSAGQEFLRLADGAKAAGRWEEAEDHYRQAVAMFVEMGDRSAQALAHRSLGVVVAQGT